MQKGCKMSPGKPGVHEEYKPGHPAYTPPKSRAKKPVTITITVREHGGGNIKTWGREGGPRYHPLHSVSYI